VINLATETLLSLTDGTRLIPPARRGQKCHLSTLLRWILKGARAPDGTLVKLEAIRLGGRWMTAREAIQRFAERLTPRLDPEPGPTARTDSARRQAAARAAAELERRGV
jgi:hypothetical protein